MKVYMLTIIERNLGVESIINVNIYRNIKEAITVAKDYNNYGYKTKVEKKEVL